MCGGEGARLEKGVSAKFLSREWKHWKGHFSVGLCHSLRNLLIKISYDSFVLVLGLYLKKEP